jgi:hypothetical protein
MARSRNYAIHLYKHFIFSLFHFGVKHVGHTVNTLGSVKATTSCYKQLTVQLTNEETN